MADNKSEHVSRRKICSANISGFGHRQCVLPNKNDVLAVSVVEANVEVDVEVEVELPLGVQLEVELYHCLQRALTRYDYHCVITDALNYLTFLFSENL